MKIKPNTPEVWDDVWAGFSDKELKFNVERERRSLQWKRVRARVLSEFGSFRKIRSIEIGAGQGIHSLLFALEGAKATVLDYSQKALDSSKRTFRLFKVKGSFVRADALDLPKKSSKLLRGNDVSMSFGTAEHFKGDKRLAFVKAHLDSIREGGLAIIQVPNKWNIPYRAWKFMSQAAGRWQFGEEYPFSRAEFREIGEKLGCKFEIFGSYLFETQFRFSHRLKKLLGVKPDWDVSRIKRQFGTPFDGYFSSSLAAIARKPKG